MKQQHVPVDSILRVKRLKTWAGDILIPCDLVAKIPLMPFGQKFSLCILFQAMLLPCFAIAGGPYWANSEAKLPCTCADLSGCMLWAWQFSDCHLIFVICPPPGPCGWHLVHRVLYPRQCGGISTVALAHLTYWHSKACVPFNPKCWCLSITSPCSILYIQDANAVNAL